MFVKLQSVLQSARRMCHAARAGLEPVGQTDPDQQLAPWSVAASGRSRPGCSHQRSLFATRSGLGGHPALS